MISKPPRSCVGDPTRLHSGRGRIKWGTHFGFMINHVFFLLCVCGCVGGFGSWCFFSRPSELFPVAFARVGGRVIAHGVVYDPLLFFFPALPQQQRFVDLGQRHTTIWKEAPMMKNTESPSFSSLCWPRAPSPRDATHIEDPSPPTRWVGPLPTALIDTNMRSLHTTRPHRCVSQTALASPREVTRLSHHISTIPHAKKVPASVAGRCWLEHTRTHVRRRARGACDDGVGASFATKRKKEDTRQPKGPAEMAYVTP